MPARRHILLFLVTVFAVEWVLLAITPVDRADWALENVLAMTLLVVLVATRRLFPLTTASYTLIFVFLYLHEIGAHYTYAMVPYDEWVIWLTGGSLNQNFGFGRNHFDRLAHFAYGLLLYYPVRELLVRTSPVRGFWSWFIPLNLLASTSMLFELFEWGAAELFGGDLGIAYLGTQGDVWDAHKDMVLAVVGAVVAMALILLLKKQRHPNSR